jgi:hypothetical protein
LEAQELPADDESPESPETKIVPTEDMNTIQHRISGEKFPEIILELCDSCHWSLICFNRRGIVEECPDCEKVVSQISMSIYEVCLIKYDDKRGVTIRFDREKPLR